jgi:hypothetical protein
MIERLSRFTPNAAGIDRDALLFAAGRRLARASRLWPALAVLLTVTQTLTLVVLWPHSTERAPAFETPAVRPSPEPSLPPTSAPRDVWCAGSPPEIIEARPRSSTGEFVSSGPTLTVRSRLEFE